MQKISFFDYLFNEMDAQVEQIIEEEEGELLDGDDELGKILADAEEQERISNQLFAGNRAAVNKVAENESEGADDLDSFNPREFEENIQVFDLLRQDNCVHEVAVPKCIEFAPYDGPKRDPVKTFPFTLDAFQTEAIDCLDSYQSVLVSAHTSAGKTVVAL
jgi:superfamily II RNA helicase